MPVAVLGWLVTLSSYVPEIRGDLVQYWPFDDGATNAASDTAHNAIADGNVGELIDFDLDNAPNDTPGDWVTTDLPPQLAHSTGALDFDPLTNGYVDGGTWRSFPTIWVGRPPCHCGTRPARSRRGCLRARGGR